ncbi:MAG: sulfotransferase [Thermoguttaceae bacterium]
MYRMWHLRAWSGMTVTIWWRALWRNRFRIHPTRVPMVAIITLISLLNSALALVQRLLYRRRIEATPIVEDPVFVLGHWRSGTTLMQELLVCDPRHAAPDTYSCFAPNHFLLTEPMLSRLLGLLLPSHRPMDNVPMSWDQPQEDEWALCNMGLPSPYLTMLFPNRPPQDPGYLDLRGIPTADRERWKAGLAWFLKSVTLRNPRRMVLKTPLHTARVQTLLEMFPKARFVHVVRDPYVIFPSTMHTWRQLYRFEGVQAPRFAGLEEHVLDTFDRMYAAFEEDVRRLPPSQFCELRFEDLVRDMPGQMRRVYRQLELGDFEPVAPAVAAYAAKTAHYQRNRYQIDEETRNRIGRRWRGYIEKYGYTNGSGG